jgi:hypothetical protein
MIDLSSNIERIKSLLEQNTPQSVVYAALEARLALEKICYDRLRQRHDYISNSDLKKWQPHYIVNTLLAEVDPYVGQTMSMWVANSQDVNPRDEDYVHIGTEIGIDPSRISKLWNAISNLALHVKIPEDKTDSINEYGETGKIASKVHEIIAELERLAEGKFTYSGFGEEISFECSCGQLIKRRAALLKEGQSINCFNLQCLLSYEVVIDEAGIFNFRSEIHETPCRFCGKALIFSRRSISNMKYGEIRSLACKECGKATNITLMLGVERPAVQK